MKAHAIAEHIGDLHRQVQLCERLHLFHLRIGNFSEALTFAKRGEAVASVLGDPLRMAHIQTALGISYHLAGDGALARCHLEAALLGLPRSQPAALPHLSFDYLSRARTTLARVLWLQGYPARAVSLARQALADAIRMNHPVKLSMTLLWALAVFLWNSELETAEECIDRFIIEADKHSLGPYQTIGRGAKGELLVRQGEVEAGIILLRSSLETMSRYRYGALTAFSTALAEGLARTGQQEEALRIIDQAIALVEHNQDLFGMPDLLRTKAEIMISGVGADLIQAERHLKDSLRMASCQSSLAWELRSATTLARLWMQQGRHAEARHTLSPIYARFTEGFDCSDLNAARELLSELSTY
jgi:tetratricopeptide (TPR) repeat protein